MLAELKTNMNSMTDLRINLLKTQIQENLDLLRAAGDNASRTYGPEYGRLFRLFDYLSSTDTFKDVAPVLEKIIERSYSDLLKPDRSLLELNPVKYWENMIDYANRNLNNTNHILKLYKEYVKYNGVLSSDDKTHLFTAIKNLNKSIANIAEVDKILFNKNLEHSKIIRELISSRGR